jgi:hypothetical protein
MSSSPYESGVIRHQTSLWHFVKTNATSFSASVTAAGSTLLLADDGVGLAGDFGRGRFADGLGLFAAAFATSLALEACLVALLVPLLPDEYDVRLRPYCFFFVFGVVFPIANFCVGFASLRAVQGGSCDERFFSSLLVPFIQ